MNFSRAQNYLKSFKIEAIELDEAETNDEDLFIPYLQKELVQCGICSRVILPLRFVEHFDKCRKAHNNEQTLIVEVPEQFRADEDFSYEPPKKEVPQSGSNPKIPVKRKRPSSGSKKIKKSRVLDLDKNCGVMTENGPCYRSITCKNHSVAMKYIIII
eukprot:NODE_241_length_11910_cov_1.082381.p12 type:complete len:158 gc:universal NODE_241_length_11910_cov_1.082381:5858-5385(-)